MGLYIRFYSYRSNSKEFSFSQIILCITNRITGNTDYCYQFWYLYALLGMYAFTFILRPFIKTADKKCLLGFICVSIICFSVFPYISGLFNFEWLNIWTKYFCFFGSYSGYYVLGYYLDKYGIGKKLLYFITTLTIIGVALTAVANIGIFGKVPSDSIITYSSPYVYLLSTSIFCWTKVLCEKFSNKNSAHKILYTLSKYTLGVYILHVIFITVLIKFLKIDTLPVQYAFITVPALTIIVYLISMAVAFIISKIPKINYFI